MTQASHNRVLERLKTSASALSLQETLTVREETYVAGQDGTYWCSVDMDIPANGREWSPCDIVKGTARNPYVLNFFSEILDSPGRFDKLDEKSINSRGDRRYSRVQHHANEVSMLADREPLDRARWT